ncbi:MAG: hypothetical protein GWN99_20250 [Gemmatimonadetes bacterium]|uniref:Uncharacterized protein n=1 Tax=Candidatus Kutchimonas denitrificans TaxID=3056748 RepID=A0AAE4ZCA2_9BACT|nr:hypothetical protein [Gemmatimonadota bacterium]NIR76536.1 hypothetical protein [Candidatus Kutchimonas denitrificans]NIS03354.1 hypothetical protein [Gemmatimonadota bacterium]NIT69215.1 hypothetical protein [Gemmatimonadota bacterium]NIU54607.1 hypothetical protein [Gemmatimonadota bacterium]
MTDETQQPPVPKARVATRPGASELSEHRRRIYQRHLLVFLAVAVAVIAVDQITSPGIQWAHFPLVPLFLVFLLHTIGLLSRGYSVFELLIPPRSRPVKAVYTVPLDYELVRARQLHDGVNNVANAVRSDDPQLADGAVAAAGALLEALERLAASQRGRKYRTDGDDASLAPEVQDALEELDRLHRELLKFELLEGGAHVPLDSVKERADAVRQLAD